MTIPELFVHYHVTANNPIQMVLKFVNNNDRLILPTDMDPNSKFMRASKRRLGEDFVFDGIIQGDVIINGTEKNLGNTPADGYVYRTHTPNKNDYFLFISENFKLLENIKKKSYKSVQQKSNQQLTLNSITEPNKDRELSIVGGCCGNDYWFCMSSPLFSVKEYKSQVLQNTTGYEYAGQYMGVVYALKTALNYCDKIDVIKIYRDTSIRNCDGVFKLPLGEWKPFNKTGQAYIDEMHRLKKAFQEKGISICFKK